MKKTSKIKPLSVTEIKSYHIDYNDFERFVKEVYGKTFEFVSDQECTNDSSHEFHATKGKLNKYDQKKLDEFTNDGDYFYTTEVILNDLCHKGLIKSGHYIIRVCW